MKKEKSTETAPENTVNQAAPEAQAPSQAAENKITKVGSLLKEMRLQKGLRLPDIAKKLCIRKIYLEAIEESNYAEIPPFPYGIGFVRSYATYLGLNSGNIVELYKDETMPKSDKEMFVLEPQSEASMPSKAYLLASLIAIALVYAGWSAYNNGALEEKDNTVEAVSAEENAAVADMPIVVEDFSAAPVAEVAEEETVSMPENDQITVTEASFVEEELAAPVAAPEQAAPASREDTPAEAPVVKSKSGIVINVKEETWVEVKDAEKLYLSKVLQPGETYTVPEGSGMILSVGRVNAVDVLVNGVITPVIKPNKKMNINLDPYMSAAH